MDNEIQLITDNLAEISDKVGDVLRAQKDSVLSRVDGVGLVVDEAMSLREVKRRVDDITWSKVQAVPAAIAETQVYALRQLDALSGELESKTTIGELATAAKKAESLVPEWLAVLDRCFQLQDAITVLELDRVLDESPEEVDGHRRGLTKARQDRLELIMQSTQRLLTKLDAVAGMANARVLLHPAKSPALVESSNLIATGVHDFHERLGIESGRQLSEKRRWVHAGTEVRDKAFEQGAKSVDAAWTLGAETFDRAGSLTGKLSSEISGRARRWLGDDDAKGNEPEGTEVESCKEGEAER